MLDSPDKEWRRLTAHYAEMWDEDLLNIVADYKYLTDTAKQVLRDELRKRNLAGPAAAANQPAAPAPTDHLAAFAPADSTKKTAAKIYWETQATWRGPDPVIPDAEDGQPHEYTWKVRLCECETSEQASQLADALQGNGIDCWINFVESKYSVGLPTISVGADQLDQARAVTAQPIPQDILEESKEESSDQEYFEISKGPYCGAPDPVLAPTEEVPQGDSTPDSEVWVNTWNCEACGREWSTPAAEA